VSLYACWSFAVQESNYYIAPPSLSMYLCILSISGGGSVTIQKSKSKLGKMNYSGQRGTKRLRVDEISFRDIVADSVEAKTISVTDAFTFPSVDGTVNQVMKTDGNGLVTWADGGGGGTTPSLQEVFDASGTTPTILSSEPLYFESNPADPSTNPLITTF